MTKSGTHDPPPSHRAIPTGLSLALLAVLVCVLAFTFAAWVASSSDGGTFTTALVEDVEAFEQLASNVRTGGIPYVDVEVEHLPVALGAMVIVDWLSDLSGVAFWALWIPAMIACFVASVAIGSRLPEGGSLGVRYLIVSAPLLPLVLFRVEPIIALLAALAVAAWLGGRSTAGTVWTTLASFGKGWPIATLAIPAKRGDLRRSVVIAAVIMMGLAAMFVFPGFRDARQFDGIHTETMIGSLLLGIRHFTDSDLGLTATAGAIYVDAQFWLVVLNSFIGVAVGSATVVLMRRSDDTQRTLLLTVGLLTFAIMLTSPLLSTQFLFWPALFVAAADTRTRSWYVAAGLCGLALVSVFEPSGAWWAVVNIAKNVLIGVVVLRMAAMINQSTTAPSVRLSQAHP